MSRLFLRLSPFHLPIARRLLREVNSLITSILRTTNQIKIEHMTTEQALGVVETARNIIIEQKARNTALTAALEDVKAKNAANVGVITALQEEIDKLKADDERLDAALASLAADITPAPDVVAEQQEAESSSEVPTEGTAEAPATEPATGETAEEAVQAGTSN